jgi:hypothetical protein
MRKNTHPDAEESKRRVSAPTRHEVAIADAALDNRAPMPQVRGTAALPRESAKPEMFGHSSTDSSFQFPITQGSSCKAALWHDAYSARCP